MRSLPPRRHARHPALQATLTLRRPDVKTAIGGLEAIPDIAKRIYAEVASKNLYERFLKHTEFKESGSSASINRLLSRGSFKVGKYVSVNPPGTDHPILFNGNGKPALFLSQPYGPFRSTWLQEIAEYCDRYELDFRIDMDSFHFPGATASVWFWRKEEPENSPPVFRN